MATSPFTGTTVQDTYDYGRGRAALGERPRANIYQDRPTGRLLFARQNVSQVDTLTITAANAGDAVAIKIDGATIPFTAGADPTATAAAAAAALDAAGAGGVFADVLGDSSSAAAVVTINFADFGPHDVEFVGTVGTTGTFADPATTPGTQAVAALPGRVAVYDPAGSPTPTETWASEPTVAGPNRPVGVVSRSPYPSQQKPPNQFGLTAPGQWPSGVMVEAWQKAEVECAIAADVTPGDAVFFVCDETSPDNGKFVTSDGSTPGTGQESELTITPAAGQDISFFFTPDGEAALPPIGPIVSVDLATDNAAVRDALNSSFAYASRFAEPAEVNAGVVLIHWAPEAVYAFTDASEPAAAVAHAVTSPAAAGTAANAAPYPGAHFTESRTAEQGTAIVDLG